MENQNTTSQPTEPIANHQPSNNNSYSKSASADTKHVRITGSGKINTQELVLTGMFTAVICVLALIEIPTQPIPFTFSLLAIFLTGALLSPRYSLLAVLVYLLLGAFGLPVYAGFKSGFQTLFGPTGGFLMAYPVMAFVTSLFCKYMKNYRLFAAACGMAVSLILCYLLGSLWFTFILDKSFSTALTLCVYPFVLFDLVKIVLAVTISTVIRKTVLRGSITGV